MLFVSKCSYRETPAMPIFIVLEDTCIAGSGVRNTCWCRRSQIRDYILTSDQVSIPARTPVLRISQFLPADCLLWCSLCGDSLLVPVCQQGTPALHIWKSSVNSLLQALCALDDWQPSASRAWVKSHCICTAMAAVSLTLFVAAIKYLTEALKEGRVYCGSQFRGIQSTMAGKSYGRRQLVNRELWMPLLR